MTRSRLSPHGSRARTAWLMPALLALGACGLNPPSISVPGPAELTTRVRALLSSDARSPADYHRARVELEDLGPEIDTVLVALAFDASARPVARANALTLLAERDVPAALSTLRWALLTADDELIRSSAVLGLHRLAPNSPEAQNAIRSALADPSPRVRLNALQSLDVHDVRNIRALVRVEEHPLVGMIARQLLGIMEARGAPLEPDPDGLYRTATADGEARLVFRPLRVQPAWAYARGELGLEAPGGGYLPLAEEVEMVRSVLPAFFSPDRSTIVIEAARIIQIRDLETRETMYLGPGVAPRPIPFTDSFLFLRERKAERREGPTGTELVYDVLRTEFRGSAPHAIGELRVSARPETHGNLSPVRWMTVGETADGWVLRVEGAPVFEIQHRNSDVPELEPDVATRRGSHD